MEYPVYRQQVLERYDAMRRAPADDWRPRYHLTPLAGTLGDPNGLCQWGDTFHIFYVTSPLSCVTTQRTPCIWAHCTTRVQRFGAAAGRQALSLLHRQCPPPRQL